MFFSSRRRHTRSKRDWSSDVCSSDLEIVYYTLPCYFLKVNYNFENILFLGKIQIIQGGGLSCQTYCQWGQKGFKIFIQKMCAYFLDSLIFENMHTLSWVFLILNKPSI